MDEVYQTLKDALTHACSACGFSGEEIVFEKPAERAHGDVSTNIAFRYAPQVQKSPTEVAKDILAYVSAPSVISHASVAGNGFLNFSLRPEVVRALLTPSLEKGEAWGKGSVFQEKKVLVEYTDPNPFKPFHIGHLMSNAVGESISRLYEYAGAEVRRANYQGDVGLHVAKCLWGLQKIEGDPHNIEDLGRAYVEGSRSYEESEEARAEIVAMNKAIYAKDSSIREAYTIGREVSLAHFEEIYRMLGTNFDYYFFESDTEVAGRALVKEGLASGVFEESEGALVYHGEDDGLHTRVFLTREGLPTYDAKELGLAERKAEKWAFDESVSITAVEQKEYFKVVFAVLARLRPEIAHKFFNVTHGMMQLASGKMSSRKGNVVTGESLLNDLLALAREKVKDRDLPEGEKEQIAQAVAVSAVKYSVLRPRAGKDIVFDPEKSLSFEGDSGPYLLYAHTRAVCHSPILNACSVVSLKWWRVRAKNMNHILLPPHSPN
jgi:arginyl-tRNA synthetase